MGKVTPWVAEQKPSISAGAPGSWPATWLHGTPTTVSPRPPYSCCSASSWVCCGVRPHRLATFTTSVAPPPVSPRRVVP
jgi:hypothetical protein